MRKVPIVTGQIYHIFNRGVNKQDIFINNEDYKRFLTAAIHYQEKKEKFTNRVDDEPGSIKEIQIFAYCIMPNHFHFLVRQLEDGGLSSYMHRITNSYAHYMNMKYERVGALFQGRYKNVLIENDEQLMHVSRYIHLNPLIANIVFDLSDYKWSSYLAYIRRSKDKLCDTSFIMDFFSSADDYERFVLDQADYIEAMERMKELLIDD